MNEEPDGAASIVREVLSLVFVACVAVVISSEALAGGEPCLAYLIPPGAEVFPDPSLARPAAEGRKDWSIGVPHPGTVFYVGNKIKLDGAGSEKKAGGCQGRDVHSEGGLIQLWFEPDRLRGEAIWVRLTDVQEFRWPNPGGWNSQNVATNINSLKASAAKALEGIVKKQREEARARDAAASAVLATAASGTRTADSTCDEERHRLQVEVERLKAEVARLSDAVKTLLESSSPASGAAANPESRPRE